MVTFSQFALHVFQGYIKRIKDNENYSLGEKEKFQSC